MAPLPTPPPSHAPSQPEPLNLPRRLFLRVWHSATFMTWGSLAARAVSIVVLLPLVLHRFPTEEVALWQLFVTIAGIQYLGTMGFSPTLSRVVAFALAGAPAIGDFREVPTGTSEAPPNWDLLGRILPTIRRIFVFLAMAWLVLLLGLAWIPVAKLVRTLAHPADGWYAWWCLAITTALRLYGSQYASYMEGFNQIALARRWETAVWLLTSIATVIVVAAGGGLLALVVCTQAFGLLGTAVTWRLVRRLAGMPAAFASPHRFDRTLFLEMWSRSWRSMIGQVASAGLVQGSAIVYAGLGSTSGVAAYLLALNLIRNVELVSQAPFYSKLPLLARRRAEGRIDAQIPLAKRAMTLALWTFLVGALGLGIALPPTLAAIHSSTPFVSPFLWALMALAGLLKRHAAMHLQLYSTTNHIVWHIADGVTGILYLLALALLAAPLGVLAFPLSQLISQTLFYSWYCPLLSCRALGLPLIAFDRAVLGPPLAVMLLYLAAVCCLG